MERPSKLLKILFCFLLLMCKEGFAEAPEPGPVPGPGAIGTFTNNNTITNTNTNTNTAFGGAGGSSTSTALGGAGGVGIGGSSTAFGGSSGALAQSGNSSVSVTNNTPRTVFPAGSTIIPLAPQNVFNDPGTGANVTGIPLIWYYIDSFGMSNCEGLSEPIVETTAFVSVSFQPDCATALKPTDVNLAQDRPVVFYSSDLQANQYYSPLGVIMAQARWDKSDDVNLFTLMKSASNFAAKNIKGYDVIILVGDILQRNISSQRSIEGMSQGMTVTPSISSTLGTDGIGGAMFGYGRSNGESHPVSRTGVTLLVVGVAPGPWAGRTPKITQTDYVTKATALPQDIQKKATEGSDSTPINILKNNDEDTASNKSTVKKAVIVKSSGRRRH